MESNTKGRETKNMKLQAQIISISGNEATVMNESFPVFKLPLSLLEGHKLGDIITIEIANNTLDRPHLLEGSKTAESVEEAAVRRFNERLGTENDGAYYIGFKDGADWQAFRSQPESNGWIRVETELPKKNDRYFCCWTMRHDKTPQVSVLTYKNGFNSNFIVTHWQPLPAPPKVEDKETK